jgi:restriction system protein
LGVETAESRSLVNRKQNGLEAFVDLIALAPWWAGVSLAVVSYFVLGSFAHVAPAAVKSMDEMPTLMAISYLKGLAHLGQFLVPVLCLIAAILSAIARKSR